MYYNIIIVHYFIVYYSIVCYFIVSYYVLWTAACMDPHSTCLESEIKFYYYYIPVGATGQDDLNRSF